MSRSPVGPECAYCGKAYLFVKDGRVPTHDWPPPCRQVCPGSKMPPREPGAVLEKDQRFDVSRSHVATPHTCGYRTAMPGDEDEDEATGPACGKPAEWRHCVLLVPVCAEHRCRCRTPIEPSRSPVGGPAPRVFEGCVDDQYCLRKLGRMPEWTDASCWLGPLVGKRVRITIEVLPEPPTDGRTRLRFRHSRDGVFEISAEAVASLRAFEQREPDATEAGGVLLGRYIRDGHDIIVDSITTPQPTDVRARYAFDRNGEHQRFINEAWERSAGTCTFLGDWHTHAEPDPSPSALDLENWKRMLREDICENQACFFLIVGQREIRCWEGNRSTGTVTSLHLVQP